MNWIRNPYARAPDSPWQIDRLGEQRADAALIERMLHHPGARATLIWQTGHWVVDQQPQWVPLAECLPAPREEPPGGAVLYFLGIDREQIPCFALDCSAASHPETIRLGDRLPASEGEFVDLRRVGPAMEPGQASLLAYARGLALWHARHRFCARCGSVSHIQDGGHRRHCPACGTDHFPRNDPAVIVLITHGDEAFLARNPRFPVPGMHSTLAGFVEPGESLEDAVVREVAEESAIALEQIRYHSSQPWPFPCSLMVGFVARARDKAFRLNTEELAAAGWFSRKFLQDSPEDPSFRLPRADSIARRLIADWLVSGES